MSIDKTYRCDLCGDTHPADALTGLYFQSWPKEWIEKPARQTEHHICAHCRSSIQALPAICGQGFECDGGPTCGSDHK